MTNDTHPEMTLEQAQRIIISQLNQHALTRREQDQSFRELLVLFEKRLAEIEQLRTFRDEVAMAAMPLGPTGIPDEQLVAIVKSFREQAERSFEHYGA